ncbi:MAG: sulfatase-like hydrolase/transferase [Gemmatimonadetes bacterium]|jgi:arylsulfatase|nr:sulfatase-like hydrolase/transferase [Gemmatimonadota bacterium]MBT6145957.1 sulfatase-like hydrolase/transferase [Gemmatimonadota bacterium]MBT7859162.1 sulfatase-like hydrolase/transferase [Gemmatimonadota bacterium]
MSKPNVLFIMADQLRADTIAALGNGHIYTPNLDRLVARGVSFHNAYSQTPVCVAARYAIRTGRDPLTTRVFSNGSVPPVAGQSDCMTERCGPYLAQTMRDLGYRTFGIGKFHAHPWDEDLGYDVHLHSEEIVAHPERRAADAYGSYIARERPAYDFVEGLHGERTEMYYMPQMSPMPAECTVEAWVADRAVEQIGQEGEKPFFGFCSFIGPHPPLAPPIPFNRLYDPDRMPDPVHGDRHVDHADEQIPWMNHGVWAEDVSDAQARMVKARYYGEITYIDDCLGRILDAVEARDDADNTVICFFADHGDHLGDHDAWQKESFFEASCHVPFLVSWPQQLPTDTRSNELVALTDLFGIATSAAGKTQLRDGSDVLGMLRDQVPGRDRVIGLYGAPGSQQFKVMVREQRWKYIWLANGSRELLFDVTADPQELRELSASQPDVTDRLRQAAVAHLSQPSGEGCLEADQLAGHRFEARPLKRIYQFGHWPQEGHGFPTDPGQALRQYQNTVRRET